MVERSVWSCLCHEPEHKHEILFLFLNSNPFMKNVFIGQVETWSFAVQVMSFDQTMLDTAVLRIMSMDRVSLAC